MANKKRNKMRSNKPENFREISRGKHVAGVAMEVDKGWIKRLKRFNRQLLTVANHNMSVSKLTPAEIVKEYKGSAASQGNIKRVPILPVIQVTPKQKVQLLLFNCSDKGVTVPAGRLDFGDWSLCHMLDEMNTAVYEVAITLEGTPKRFSKFGGKYCCLVYDLFDDYDPGLAPAVLREGAAVVIVKLTIKGKAQEMIAPISCSPRNRLQ